MSELPSELQQRIATHGQEHIYKFWEELNDTQQVALEEQLVSIDFDQFEQLRQLFADQVCEKVSKAIEPCPYVSIDDERETELLHEKGASIIRRGELGILTVAGGQGTRLGWNGPKGTFPATPVTGKSLFQVIAEKILFASRAYSVTIPWYIMTSQENDSVTRSFLLDNNCFGLRRSDISIFAQSEVPVIDANEKMLLSSKHRVAMNPDGHGGVFAALHRSGGLVEMERRGIKYLSYVQVDNPLANVIDPVFLALHVNHKNSSAEISSKCVKRTDPDEKVGVFCRFGGNTTIVEYNTPQRKLITQVDSEGELVYQAGSVAIHMFSVDFLQRIGDDLPWHIAHKKVSHISITDGKRIETEEPNAYKFERFVFDVLPLAKKPLVFKTSRAEEFAPIKNKSGEDSPETSHALQQQRAMRWLQHQGVSVSDAATVEISPLTANRAKDIKPNEIPSTIEDGETIAL